jgi:hypothetical protein
VKNIPFFICSWKIWDANHILDGEPVEIFFSIFLVSELLGSELMEGLV